MQNRIPPPFIMITGIALIWGADRIWPEYSLAVAYQNELGMVLAGLGLLIILSGVITFFFARTTINPLKPSDASKLVSGGIFQVTRNPMYLGMALLIAGFAIRVGHYTGPLIVLIFVIYINELQIKPEEKALREIFGEEFENYCKKVRRWV